MEVPIGLSQSMMNFLTELPAFSSEAEREAVINGANLDNNLKSRIDYNGNAWVFLSKTIDELVSYGSLENERDALAAFLESTKILVGVEKQAKIDEFIKEWERVLINEGNLQKKIEQLKANKGSSKFRHKPGSQTFDRTTDKRRIVKAIESGKYTGLMLVGMRGIGKSMIAKAVLETYSQNPRFSTIIHASFQTTDFSPQPGFSTATPGMRSIEQLYALIFERHERSDLISVENPASKLRELLQRKSTLVIIDSFEVLMSQDGQIPRDLLDIFLESYDGSFFLLTSFREPDPFVRSRLLNFKILPVKSFDEKTTISYLAQLTPYKKDANYFRQIYKEIGGQPLWLNLTAQYLRLALEPEQVLEKLRTHERDLQRFLFEENVKQLTPNDIAVLAAVAISPSLVCQTRLKQFTGLDDVIDSVLRLVLNYMVERDQSSDCYFVHPLLRKYILDLLNRENRTLLKNLQERFVAWAVDLVKKHSDWEFNTEQEELLKKELTTIQSALELVVKQRQKGSSTLDEEDFFLLGRSVAHLLHINGQWKTSEPLLKVLLNELTDGPFEVGIRVLLARHYSHDGQDKEAQYYLEPAFDIARKIGNKSILSEVELRMGQSQHLLNPREARPHLEYARKNGDSMTKIASVGYLAEIHLRRMHPELALKLIEEVAEELATLGWDRVRAHHARLKAEAYIDLGKDNLARATLQESQELLSKIVERRLRGWILLCYAKLDEDTDKANEALKIFRELGLSSEIERTQLLIYKLELAKPPVKRKAKTSHNKAQSA